VAASNAALGDAALRFDHAALRFDPTAFALDNPNGAERHWGLGSKGSARGQAGKVCPFAGPPNTRGSGMSEASGEQQTAAKPLVPNAETIEAMEEARRGEHVGRAASVAELFAQLHAADDVALKGV
jgi:hypothetical protein